MDEGHARDRRADTPLKAGKPRQNGQARPALVPGAAYVDWHGLAAHTSLSPRWLQEHVPPSIRFSTGGKTLVRLAEFDAWFERFRLGQDLARIADEMLDSRRSSLLREEKARNGKGF